jgi:hypothetical protein
MCIFFPPTLPSGLLQCSVNHADTCYVILLRLYALVSQPASYVAGLTPSLNCVEHALHEQGSGAAFPRMQAVLMKLSKYS